ncbi:MAG: glutamine-hydrolyzing carbamoyl-phosphate synthase small subunit [bacterium]
MKGILVLEDGSHYEGLYIGAKGERPGEVVLNTAVVGYQEIMTDSANAGKILVLTYPLIGNYGMAGKFSESDKCLLNGLVIKEESRITSNWQSEEALGSFLKKEDIVAISEIDTRTVAVSIREKGEMLGILSDNITGKVELLKRLKDYKKNRKTQYIKKISVKEVYECQKAPSGKRIGILDLGVLKDFIDQLKNLGSNITLIPYNLDERDILSLNLDGLIISNGPEEDDAVPQIVEMVRKLMGKLPVLGISLGHEIIGLALGAERRKMKVGHHGVNYPVSSYTSNNKGEITVQNHSWVLDDESIKEIDHIRITSRNINDNSIEEMESGDLGFISAQYYPVSPGFNEVNDLFIRFFRIIDKRGNH